MDTGSLAPITAVLWRATQRIARTFDQLLAEHGGSRPVFFILMALRNGPRETQRELAASIGLGEATVTHHLTAMEQRGLITRHREVSDRRVQQIRLTPAGASLLEKLRTEAAVMEAEVRAAIGSPAQVEELAATLRRMADAVDEGSPPPLV